jgi:5-methylcytosine-specific restriction endonuclease McrA
VKRVLKQTNKEKLKKSKELLGYSHQELQERLFNHPNLKEIGDSIWVVDHIFPIKAFLEYGIEDISLINSLDNLQPLEERENLVKNDKYSKEEFEDYLKSKGIDVRSQCGGRSLL